MRPAKRPVEKETMKPMIPRTIEIIPRTIPTVAMGLLLPLDFATKPNTIARMLGTVVTQQHTIERIPQTRDAIAMLLPGSSATAGAAGAGAAGAAFAYPGAGVGWGC